MLLQMLLGGRDHLESNQFVSSHRLSTIPSFLATGCVAHPRFSNRQMMSPTSPRCSNSVRWAFLEAEERGMESVPYLDTVGLDSDEAGMEISIKHPG